MSHCPAHLAMIAAAALSLGCTANRQEDASAELSVARNATEDKNPFPAAAETPMFWSEAQWRKEKWSPSSK